MTKSFLHGALLAATTLLCGFFTSGCHTVSTDRIAYIAVPQYPPTDPATIEFLQKEPSRPFEKLGEVTAAPDPGTPAPKIETAMRKQAAKLGADALVLVYDKLQVVGSRVWGPGWAPEVSNVNQRVIVAIAIKYKPAPAK